MINVLNSILVAEANRLDGDLYQRSIHTSPWIDLVDTGAFPEGVGDVVSTMIWERTFPTGTIQWQNLMGSAAGNDVVIPGGVAPLVVSTAKTLREYRLQACALESDPLNVNNLRTAAMREDQLGGLRDNLSMNTNYLWRTRARQEYDRLVTHVNLVAAGNVETSGGAADVTQPDTLLSNAALTRYRNRMIRMGAGRRSLDRIDGAPIFGLICDSEVSDALKAETAITEALKFSNRANELLTPLGIEKAYKNFFHIIDDLAPRYTFTSSGTVTGVTSLVGGSGYTSTPTVAFAGGGTGATGYAILINGSVAQVVVSTGGTGYSAAAVTFTGGSPSVPATATSTVGGSLTEVQPYTTQAPNPAIGQFGNRLIENPAYETAALTKSFIYHQDVMKLLYPNSVVGSNGASFDPVSYRGEWKWLNVVNIDKASAAYNPDGTIGNFRGVFAAATKPMAFEFGFSVIHKRPGF